jgi:hypothetical protein
MVASKRVYGDQDNRSSFTVLGSVVNDRVGEKTGEVRGFFAPVGIRSGSGGLEAQPDSSSGEATKINDLIDP